MFERVCVAPLSSCASVFKNRFFIALFFSLVFCGAGRAALAQSLTREFNSPEQASLIVRNHNGRVQVIATEEMDKKVTLEAQSPGAAVAESDIVTLERAGKIEIDVRARREKDRIDLTVRVPPRSRVRVESEAGAVDVIGNFAAAEVTTDTGTIRTDVPTDAVALNFTWQASRPRFFSDVTLPQVKEGRGGVYSISGSLGEKRKKKGKKEKKEEAKEPAKDDAEQPASDETENKSDEKPTDDKKKKNEEKSKKDDHIVRLDFSTRRGVVIFNVDPDMVPSDLRERPLTEATKAIVRSGNQDLIEAIRKVSPKMFGDYVRTLPPRRTEPSLVTRRAPDTNVATSAGEQLMRLNASVTDRTGRAIGGLKDSDFSVFENGQERQVVSVTPTTTPFNLVLLLDVSGSVEERIDFIRKAARNFLATANSQDRIAIVSFRDDIQVISDFTTDRKLLSDRLEKIDAGGATALYDSLAYVLVDLLRPLRGERAAVVVMSDGDDNRSFVPFGALRDVVTESGVLIYPLYVPSGLIPESSVAAPDSTLDPTRSRFLTLTTRADEEGRKLAEMSGGVYYPIRRLEDLQRAYDDVVTQLRTAYTITYASNASIVGERRIHVRTSREGTAVRLSPAIAAP